MKFSTLKGRFSSQGNTVLRRLLQGDEGEITLNPIIEANMPSEFQARLNADET